MPSNGLLAAGVDRVVVAASGRTRSTRARHLLGDAVTVVVGGADRTASVAAALAAVGDDADVVLVHDAARAFAPASMIRRVDRARPVRARTPSSRCCR